MKFAALFGLAAIAAMSAATTLPAFAAEDDEPAHVSRNWKSGSGTATRGTAANQRGATRTNTTTNTVTRDTSSDVEPKVTYARPTRGNDGDGQGYGNGRRRQQEYGGLDPAEAARIRNAHRESDRRVTLHRDRDYDNHDYSVPSYSTRGYRRQNWWSLWW